MFERLRDVRPGHPIVDILEARGQLNEAICILTEKLVPLPEHLGNVRFAAVARGQVAECQSARIHA